MDYNSRIIVISVVLLTAISITWIVNDSKPDKPSEKEISETQITLGHHPCMGPCPNYEITVFGNGTGKYSDQENSKNFQISKQKYSSLINEIYRSSFFEFSDKNPEKVPYDLSHSHGLTTMTHHHDGEPWIEIQIKNNTYAAYESEIREMKLSDSLVEKIEPALGFNTNYNSLKITQVKNSSNKSVIVLAGTVGTENIDTKNLEVIINDQKVPYNVSKGSSSLEIELSESYTDEYNLTIQENGYAIGSCSKKPSKDYCR